MSTFVAQKLISFLQKGEVVSNSHGTQVMTCHPRFSWVASPHLMLLTAQVLSFCFQLVSDLPRVTRLWPWQQLNSPCVTGCLLVIQVPVCQHFAAAGSSLFLGS